MAEFIIKIGNENTSSSLVHSQNNIISAFNSRRNVNLLDAQLSNEQISTSLGYKDSDILHAFNNRRILCTHTQSICHVKHIPFNQYGLNDIDSLPEIYQRNVYQYKFERVAPKVVRRTNLWALKVEEFSDIPNAKDEYINVRLFIRRRLQNPKHGVFGSAGSEVWYGGKTDNSLARLNIVWLDIEAQTAHRKSNHFRWPLTTKEKKSVLAVASSDYDDATAIDYESPRWGTGLSAEGIEMVDRRKNYIDWKGIPELNALRTSIEDKNTIVDVREGKEYIPDSIVKTKGEV